MTNINNLNTYDQVTYESYPYKVTQPENLKTIGLLFGMHSPDVKTARVLELGCAEGGNLIPLAARYPNATFVGVDLSKVQIDVGNVHIKSLGLKNIELKHCSITDIDEKFGKFDYIICHGVISWVPEFVREKILEVSVKNLSENGIAYISYNTLPAWNMIRTIRDMMLYHSKNFVDPQEKVFQSRLLLDFVKESLDGQETPYANTLRMEVQFLLTQPDHYLRHEYLAEENKQFYFNEFVNHAAKHGLRYLSDCSLSTMYIDNMPEKVVEKLKSLNDIIRTEQYMDFITNRRFRSTLLCHNNVQLNRNINKEDIKKFTLSLNITPAKPLSEVDLNNNEDLTFFSNDNKDASLSSTSPALKSVFYVLAENINNPLSFDELVNKAEKKLKGDMKSIIEEAIIDKAMSLVLKGVIELSLEPGNKDKIDLKKPKISALTMYQATQTRNMWVTNNYHAAILVNIIDKYIMQYLDGTKNKEQIIDCLLNDIKSNKITFNKDDKKIEGEKDITKELIWLYDDLIARFSKHALFV